MTLCTCKTRETVIDNQQDGDITPINIGPINYKRWQTMCLKQEMITILGEGLVSVKNS